MQNLTDLITELEQRRIKYSTRHHKSSNYKRYISSWLEDDIIDDEMGTKKKGKALVVILRTHGCSWSRNNETTISALGHGGCTMCGYINDCLPENETITIQDISDQFRSALDKFQDKNYDLVKIYSSGSFLDDNEIASQAQKNIIKTAQDAGIENILVESRPEFLSRNKLEKIKSYFSGRLQIAIGLESCNNKILKYSINKGFTFEDYCKAVKNAKKVDIAIKTYLLLKPPFLAERDAIADILNSIKILADRELTNCVSINPVQIQKFTIIEYLFDRNDYRPPWLWSLVEVLSRGKELLTNSNIRLLSQPTAGGLRRGVHNCGECDDGVLKAIEKFSINPAPKQNLKILQDLHCSCKAKWGDAIQLENIRLSGSEIKNSCFL